jgi:hypothetical protein
MLVIVLTKQSCGNESGSGKNLLGIQMGYRVFDIWYPRFQTGIVRILGYRESRTLIIYVLIWKIKANIKAAFYSIILKLLYHLKTIRINIPVQEKRWMFLSS